MVDPYLSLGQNSEHNFSSSLSYDRNNEHVWFMSVCRNSEYVWSLSLIKHEQ